MIQKSPVFYYNTQNLTCTAKWLTNFNPNGKCDEKSLYLAVALALPMSAFANDSTTLTDHLRSVGVEQSKDKIDLYYQKGQEKNLETPKMIVQGAMKYYQETLGTEGTISLAVLDEDKYYQYAEKVGGLFGSDSVMPYGMPYVADNQDGTALVVLPATASGVITQATIMLKPMVKNCALTSKDTFYKFIDMIQYGYYKF